MADCLIVGAGVIGLSVAHELAGRGMRVRVVDRGTPGGEASWAGAGILPPAKARPDSSPYDQLLALSHRLQPEWSRRLREATGVDDGYRVCGGLYLARDAATGASLEASIERWEAHGVVVERLTGGMVAQREPQLAHAIESGAARLAVELPEESQIRNPRRLKALLSAVLQQGVEVTPGVAVDDFQIRSGRIERVVTSVGPMTADAYCITTGAWTGALLRRANISAPVRPVRGQIVLLAPCAARLTRIINEGRRYIVPRPDGRVLIGSTEEDAGFDKRTTSSGVAGLLAWALEWAPALGQATIEKTWAGLRPATHDGLPFLGRLPGLSNAFIAAGHYRAGLELSPATGVVMSQLLCGETPAVELDAFRVDRNTEEKRAAVAK